MQAVIKTGGKQYLVKSDEVLEVELVNPKDNKLELEPLMVIDGDKVHVGTPIVKGATVTAEVLAETKGDKLKVLKYKPKKRQKTITGHRQHYSQIKITKISLGK